MKNFNIYIEGELPDNCKTCQYKSIGRCVLSDENVFDYMVYETSPINCPVKPLSVRLAEERKKVVQEIRTQISKLKKLEPKHDIGYDCDDVMLSYLEISEKLDQIERGE